MPRIALLSSVALFALASCSLAPEYHQPDMPVPAAYKEAGHWQRATPDVAAADRGNWWKIYNDDDLNTLEDKVTAANQDLKAALARYKEARAEAAVARAAYFPQINAAGSAGREKLSKNISSTAPVNKFNDFDLEGDLSYEIDVWGRVRNSVEAGKSRADASKADLAAMDISLHAELAMDYFSLRGDDASQALLDQTVEDYQKAYELTVNRHNGGISPEADVDQAQTQLENAKTLAADMRLKRSQLEHAIAVLAGEMPSGFSLSVKPFNAATPDIPAGLPSALIEQRPDISAAALRVQAANADIGVARAAYFPDFTFSADLGVESAVFPKLFNAPSLIWAFGPSFTQPLFDGGKIAALSSEAHAAYDESVANYRSTVLVAFQQVEDNLVAMHRLGEENVTQTSASDAASRALQQAKNRYQGGIDTYLNVVIEQNIALQAQLSLLDIRTRRLLSSVLVIKSLGGVWSAETAATENTFPSPFQNPVPAHMCIQRPDDPISGQCQIHTDTQPTPQ